MIEYPLRPARQIRRGHSMVLAPVHEPDDLIRPPRDGEDMKIVRVCTTRQRVGPTDTVAARIARAMKRTVRDGGLASDVLHDVDLAAPRPSNRIDVRAEHPEGRPNALPAWDSDPRLEPTVRLREQSFGFEAR